jgi:rRNA maturation endonuclease Nob1
MTVVILSILLVAGVIIFTMGVRESDLPQPAPENPFRHLDEIKTRIYENLRDLQFEYRLGKLSDADYQSSKLSVQKELGQVLGEIDAVKQRLMAEGKMVASTAPTAKKKQQAQYVCPHCKASFKEALKFCGECGKAMS